MLTITYVTDGPGRTGVHYLLAATQVDDSFQSLDQRVSALEDVGSTAGPGGNGIADINQIGANLLTITTGNGYVFGPFTLPTARLTSVGQWQPATGYFVNDMFYQGGALYQVIFAHISQPSFLPGANDGAGNNYYVLWLPAPPGELPAGGNPGDALVQSGTTNSATVWLPRTRNIVVSVAGQPLANEHFPSYVSPETLILPAGLPGAVAMNFTPPAGDVSYLLYHITAASLAAGDPVFTSVGSVNFESATFGFTVTFTLPAEVILAPGDVFGVAGPAVPDDAQADISFTFVGFIP